MWFYFAYTGNLKNISQKEILYIHILCIYSIQVIILCAYVGIYYVT